MVKKKIQKNNIMKDNQLKINLLECPNLTCEKCEHLFFKKVIIIKKISKTLKYCAIYKYFKTPTN